MNKTFILTPHKRKQLKNLSKLVSLFVLLSLIHISISYPKSSAADNLEVLETTKVDPLCGGIQECTLFRKCIISGSSISECHKLYCNDINNCESPYMRSNRHSFISMKRDSRIVIAHRGSFKFAPENTLGAYLATMQIGADGNEIDIRKTYDGSLVMFHDDMTDQKLEGVFGTIRNQKMPQLNREKFRGIDEGLREYACVPYLVDVLLLHRNNLGLIHLDIKESGVDTEVALMLDVLDMWDHVVISNNGNSSAIINNPSYKPSIENYVSLYEGRRETDKNVINTVVQSNYDAFMIEDPRPILTALGRSKTVPDISSVKCNNIYPTPIKYPYLVEKVESEASLIRTILNAPNWNKLPTNETEKTQYANEILIRARAISRASKYGYNSYELIQALKTRVTNRSMHPDWMYHGLDAQEAIFALSKIGNLKVNDLDNIIREAIWRDDPALSPIAWPGTPRAWVDWRIKYAAWTSLKSQRSILSENIAKDYLSLSESEARSLGFLAFESASDALFNMSKSTSTGLYLLGNPRQDVKGSLIWNLMDESYKGNTWAKEFINVYVSYVEPWAYLRHNFIRY